MSVVHPAEPPRRQTHLQRWLGIDEKSKPLVYTQVYASAEISSLNYWLEIVFSAGIAALGLVLNSPAVIIGAMLISPLMGPIMATGLALAAGDLYLTGKAIGNLLASIALAVALSALMVWLLPFHSVTAEVLARTNPTLLDLGVALFSGLAGSVAVSRAGTSSAITTLPGVAVAVALMPPLCTMGFGLGIGANRRIIGGAGLLFLTNLVAIVSSAFVVFLLIGMNSPEVHSEMEISRQGERLARKLTQGRLGRLFGHTGLLRWRILILGIILATIAVPLRRALVQLAAEAVARGAAQDAVSGLLPPGARVSQQIEVTRSNVLIRLVSTAQVPPEKLEQAERAIEKRTGQSADISVSTIASQSALAELMARLTAPPAAPPPPPAPTLPEVYQELTARIRPIVQSVWPPEAPLQDYSLTFGDAGMVLNIRYQSPQPLGKLPLDMLERAFQEKLAAPNLTLSAQRIPPPADPRRRNSRR